MTSESTRNLYQISPFFCNPLIRCFHQHIWKMPSFCSVAINASETFYKIFVGNLSPWCQPWPFIFNSFPLRLELFSDHSFPVPVKSTPSLVGQNTKTAVARPPLPELATDIWVFSTRGGQAMVMNWESPVMAWESLTPSIRKAENRPIFFLFVKIIEEIIITGVGVLRVMRSDLTMEVKPKVTKLKLKLGKCRWLWDDGASEEPSL